MNKGLILKFDHRELHVFQIDENIFIRIGNNTYKLEKGEIVKIFK